MSDYTAANGAETADRNPKNRFFGLFCHANQVSDSWGLNWPFYCGVIMFSIVIGIMTLFDVSVIFTKFFDQTKDWFLLWFIIRFISDLIALIGIVFAIIGHYGTMGFNWKWFVFFELPLYLFCGWALYATYKLYKRSKDISNYNKEHGYE